MNRDLKKAKLIARRDAVAEARAALVNGLILKFLHQQQQQGKLFSACRVTTPITYYSAKITFCQKPPREVNVDAIFNFDFELEGPALHKTEYIACAYVEIAPTLENIDEMVNKLQCCRTGDGFKIERLNPKYLPFFVLATDATITGGRHEETINHHGFHYYHIANSRITQPMLPECD